MSSSIFHPRGGITARWCAFTVAMATLITCTMVGNIAVLLALRRARRAPAHYPLASLATADLFVGLFVLPIAAIRELLVLKLHWLICTSWETLDVLCCTASILSLCALGWERWCGITAPLARARRARQARLFAALVWPVSIAVALPTAFIYSPKHHPGETDKACPDSMNVSYVFVSSLLSFYIPASVMVVLYARILYALSVPPQIRAHLGPSSGRLSPINGKGTIDTANCSTPLREVNIHEAQENPTLRTPKGSYLNMPSGSKHVYCVTPPPKQSTGDDNNRIGGIITRQRRATRTIIRLMGLFLACWTPFFIMTPVDSLCDCVRDSIWQCCTWLGYVNSALNPLVYAAASPSVRRALHSTLSSSGRTIDMQMQTPKRRT